jgi:hypothetical protein
MAGDRSIPRRRLALLATGVAACVGGCGADPVTGPVAAGLVAAEVAVTAVEVVGGAAVAIGNALTPVPTPPPTLQETARTMDVAKARELAVKVSKGEKKFADLTIAEKQQLQLLMAVSDKDRDRDRGRDR